MRCINAVRDDLHDYAAAVLASLDEHLGAPAVASRDFGTVACRVVHRLGNLQAEVVVMRPGAVIPAHTHPGVDSIELLVAGNIALQVGPLRIARERPLRRIGVRIPQDAPHGGVASQEGVTFVSCQRWDSGVPSHIGLAWRGVPCSDVHQRLLLDLGEALDRIA